MDDLLHACSRRRSIRTIASTYANPRASKTVRDGRGRLYGGHPRRAPTGEGRGRRSPHDASPLAKAISSPGAAAGTTTQRTAAPYGDVVTTAGGGGGRGGRVTIPQTSSTSTSTSSLGPALAELRATNYPTTHHTSHGVGLRPQIVWERRRPRESVGRHRHSSFVAAPGLSISSLPSPFVKKRMCTADGGEVLSDKIVESGVRTTSRERAGRSGIATRVGIRRRGGSPTVLNPRASPVVDDEVPKTKPLSWGGAT
jgi:hypothetical protein